MARPVLTPARILQLIIRGYLAGWRARDATCWGLPRHEPTEREVRGAARAEFLNALNAGLFCPRHPLAPPVILRDASGAPLTTEN